MSDSFTCPFCNHTIPVVDSTFTQTVVGFPVLTTFSRRCLQGMIRDFFEISRNSLYEEIDAIKSKIPTEQWAVLDGLRRIGNIGAHMEKDINLIIDIEPSEAQKLIKLIELLIQQWYIERHNQQQLFADIIGIDNAKQNERKKIE